MPIATIEVKKNQNENNASVLRRFSRKVQESGIVYAIKGRRYNERPKSKLSQKAMAVRKIGRRKEMDRLRKLGKIA